MTAFGWACRALGLVYGGLVAVVVNFLWMTAMGTCLLTVWLADKSGAFDKSVTYRTHKRLVEAIMTFGGQMR